LAPNRRPSSSSDPGAKNFSMPPVYLPSSTFSHARPLPPARVTTSLSLPPGFSSVLEKRPAAPAALIARTAWPAATAS
jgi:hypothetical protein